MSRTIRKIRIRPSPLANIYGGSRRFTIEQINALRAGKPPHPGHPTIRPRVWYKTEVIERRDVLHQMEKWDYDVFIEIKQKYIREYDEIRDTWGLVIEGLKYKTVLRSYRSHERNPDYDEDKADAYHDWHQIHDFVHRNGSVFRQRRKAIRQYKRILSKVRRRAEERELRALLREAYTDY